MAQPTRYDLNGTLLSVLYKILTFPRMGLRKEIEMLT